MLISSRLKRNLRRNYFIETIDSNTFVAWYGRFTTIRIFGIRFTIIYGLDFELFVP